MEPPVTAATHAAPDFLALQLTARDPRAKEAMRALLGARGFRLVEETDDLDLQPANGCLFTRLDVLDAELLVTVGSTGASRIPLTGLDPAWLERAVSSGHAAVLLVDAAVRDGSVSRVDLQADVAAGGVLAALVPCAEAVSS